MVGDGMAYIDRKTVLDTIANYEIEKYGENKYLWDLIYEITTAEVVGKELYARLLKDAIIISKALKKYQTADAVERKHGEWIRKDGSKFLWVCSECGAVIYSEHNDDRERFHAFCGACGSDMRKETEDDKSRMDK